MEESAQNNITKQCSKCSKVKSLTDYSKHKGCRYGHNSVCKECRKIASVEHYGKNKEKYRARARKWTEKNRDKTKKYYAKYRKTAAYKIKSKINNAKAAKKHRFKINVKNKLNYYISTGKVIKPSSCEICKNKQENKLIGGHHEDYDYPLDVIWMCPDCHTNYHQGKSERAEEIRVKVKELYKKKYRR